MIWTPASAFPRVLSTLLLPAVAVVTVAFGRYRASCSWQDALEVLTDSTHARWSRAGGLRTRTSSISWEERLSSPLGYRLSVHTKTPPQKHGWRWGISMKEDQRDNSYLFRSPTSWRTKHFPVRYTWITITVTIARKCVLSAHFQKNSTSQKTVRLSREHQWYFKWKGCDELYLLTRCGQFHVTGRTATHMLCLIFKLSRSPDKVFLIFQKALTFTPLTNVYEHGCATWINTKEKLIRR